MIIQIPKNAQMTDITPNIELIKDSLSTKARRIVLYKPSNAFIPEDIVQLVYSENLRAFDNILLIYPTFIDKSRIGTVRKIRLHRLGYKL